MSPSRKEIMDKKFWQIIFADGRILTEYQCSWADVSLHDMQVLSLTMGDNIYRIDKSDCPNFKEFVYFKTAIATLSGGSVDESRCIGWHNGQHLFILRISEETGELIGDVEVSVLKNLHPMSKYIL